MARQIIYDIDRVIHEQDRLTGIDSVDNSTKNFTIEDIASFFATTGVADSSKLAFHYETDTNATAQGQASYRFAQGLQGNPRGLNQIILHSKDVRGGDFSPLLSSFIVGNDIKITSLNNINDIIYAVYAVTNSTLLNGVFTLDVEWVTSTGSVLEGNIAVTPIGSSLLGIRGHRFFDGPTVPSDDEAASTTAQAGDLYFQIFTDIDGNEQSLLWGPYNPQSATPWGVDGVLITGHQGQNGPQGIGIDTITGSVPVIGQPVTITVTLDDPSGDTTPDAQEFVIPAGAMGMPGASFDGNLLAFSSGTAPDTVDVTYNSLPAGSFSVERGIDGRSITSITGPVTTGLVDRYTINYNTAPLTSTFDVTNAKSIVSITGPTTVGLEDTYTINFNDSTSQPLVVTNGAVGRGIDNIALTNTAGLVKTYTITYTDNLNPDTFMVSDGVAGGDIEVNGNTHRPNLNFVGTAVTSVVDNTTDAITVTLNQRDDELPTTADDNQVLAWTGAAWEPQGFEVRETGDTDTPISNINAIRFAGTGVDISQGIAGEAVVTIQGGGTPDVPVLNARLHTTSQLHQEDAGLNTWTYTFTHNAMFPVSGVVLTVDNVQYQVSPSGSQLPGTTWSITNAFTGETSGNVSAEVTYQEPGDTTNRTTTISGGTISLYESSYWFIQTSDTIGSIIDTNDFELTTTSETVTIANSDVGRYLVVATPTGEYPKISTHPGGTPYVLDAAVMETFNSITYDVYIIEITAAVNLYITQ